MKKKHRKFVKLGQRHFVVLFIDEKPVRIYERFQYEAGHPSAGLFYEKIIYRVRVAPEKRRNRMKWLVKQIFDKLDTSQNTSQEKENESKPDQLYAGSSGASDLH